MRIVIAGIKKGFFIFWDDSIMLILFNFLCFLSLLPALLFYMGTASSVSVLFSAINTLLFLPLAFFLFALYRVAYDCRHGIAIKFSTFFSYLRSTWKQALIYGVINIGAVLLVGWNLRFYAQFQAEWAGIVQLVVLSVAMVWLILQIVMLPLYPRLEEPGFRQALRNAAAIMGRYLIPVLVLVVLTAVFLIISVAVQIVAMLVSFIFIAALGEGIIGEVVADIKEPPPESY